MKESLQSRMSRQNFEIIDAQYIPAEEDLDLLDFSQDILIVTVIVAAVVSILTSIVLFIAVG